MQSGLAKANEAITMLVCQPLPAGETGQFNLNCQVFEANKNKARLDEALEVSSRGERRRSATTRFTRGCLPALLFRFTYFKTCVSKVKKGLLQGAACFPSLIKNVNWAKQKKIPYFKGEVLEPMEPRAVSQETRS
ncbi:hypothetical protein EYF80_000836 [Liparis tanakae]|uniref:Uncharacterized protein n=1 Tax=Liparis tanakae TaxID=230148 RepID=A0A4Z2JH23_9TELE|nr:hypothetical protein EYF80_000836 [Liparis tanakae]